MNGRGENRNAAALFDPAAYIEANPEAATSELDPFLHYVLIGRAAGAPRSPAEALCRDLGFNYEELVGATQLAPAQLAAVLRPDGFRRAFCFKAHPDAAPALTHPSCPSLITVP